MTNPTQIQLQTISAGMAQIAEVAEKIELAGYVVPEILDNLLYIQDVQVLSIEELAGHLVSIDVSGFLGNDFDSRIVSAESAEEIAITTVQDGGIPTLYNLMSGLEGYCDEYVVYNDLEHFKTLTWDYCLDRLEEVVELVVSQHLPDIVKDYLPDTVDEVLLSVGNLTELYFELSMDLLSNQLDVEFFNSNDELTARIKIAFDDELTSIADCLEADSETAIFKVYANGCETVFNYPSQSDVESIYESIM